MSSPSLELFPDTGIQILCQPFRGAIRAGAVGAGWQFARYRDSSNAVSSLPWAQWQIVNDQCFLAVDTTLGNPLEGFVLERDSPHPRTLTVEKLLDNQDNPIANFPKFEFTLLTSFEASPRDVHLVVDFGNSRTGALLAEPEGEVHTRLRMLPFELLNRYQMNAWREGQFVHSPRDRWFSSRTCWSESPYRPPAEQLVKEYVEIVQWPWPSKIEERTRVVVPPLFDDLSMVRLGREAEDLTQLVSGDVLMAVSSPKRFLWADDSQWLQDRQWGRVVPFDERTPRRYFDRLGGRLLAYIDARDSDDLLKCETADQYTKSHTQPLEPHVPRAMMVAALYEILAQAYMYANSPPYRNLTGDANQPRRIDTLTLSYPSGMVWEERQRFLLQARKAARIFSWTMGKRQGAEPEVQLRVDEATAAQLAYVWGELQMVGANPERLFEILSHNHGPDPELPRGDDEQAESPSSDEADTSAVETASAGEEHADGNGAGADVGSDEFAQFRQFSAAPVAAPVAATSAPPRAPAATDARGERPRASRNWRLACIDVGGGTTDLMIADYTYQWGAVRKIEYEVLHRDGISRAGDYLTKRLLERLIVPTFAATVRMSREEVLFWFGEETPNNRKHRLLRTRCLNRLFVPLAQEYLERAVLDDTRKVISHFYADGQQLVEPAVLDLVEKEIGGADQDGPLVNFRQEMNLRYEPARFEEIVWDVFGVLLRDFCKRISEYRADVVLLAGQPTKLLAIQNMVRMFLPLSSSRIIPMHNHFAGNWYPYQDPKQPGVITDPKSAVVVGAALEMASQRHPLDRTRFVARPGKTKLQRYYWGVLDANRPMIGDRDILFRADEDKRTHRYQVDTNRVVIGRKLFAEPEAEAAPVYLLEIQSGREGADINVTIELERKPNPDAPTEELLCLKSVSGFVAGASAPAILDENVRLRTRTLGKETFFLDTGGLDDIRV